MGLVVAEAERELYKPTESPFVREFPTECVRQSVQDVEQKRVVERFVTRSRTPQLDARISLGLDDLADKPSP